jgi:hypothetical protein
MNRLLFLFPLHIVQYDFVSSATVTAVAAALARSPTPTGRILFHCLRGDRAHEHLILLALVVDLK